MDTDLQSLKDSLKDSYELFYASREEARLVEEMYHNRQYSYEAEAEISNRGQPLETFNVFKKYTRLLSGYFDTVSNNIKISPRQPEGTLQAEAMQSTLKYILEENKYNSVISKVKMDGMLYGLMCMYVNVSPKISYDGEPEEDSFGRPIYDIKLEHVPSQEVILDPMSRAIDYSDARFIHRYRWVSEEYVKKTWGEAAVQKLEPNYNTTGIVQAELDNTFRGFVQNWHNSGYYLIVESIVKDENGKCWRIFWSNEEELERKEITYKKVKFPYLVMKLVPSNITEYYGIFHEIIESQKALNQAIIKLQLLSVTNKHIIERKAVESVAEFERSMQSISATVVVKNLNKVQEMKHVERINELYTIIDRNMERIEQVLGINPSFLGIAPASDSGRKVKLQQQSSALSLRYMTLQYEEFARQTGKVIIDLVKQYFHAHQVLAVIDENSKEQWVEINKPFMIPTEVNGQIVAKPFFEPIEDPASGKPLKDSAGNMLMAPEPAVETDIRLADYHISIDTVNAGMEDDINQIITDMVLNGVAGQAMLQANPGRFFEMASLTARTMPTKYSRKISEMFAAQAAEMTGVPPGVGSAQPEQVNNNTSTIPGGF